ncbi:nuclear transport factor 2 family protein [Alteromonadaceae bacterium M269]|nr:nuclear transport factor 2 family protein [Alteromonadaceae bacterium M269]
MQLETWLKRIPTKTILTFFTLFLVNACAAQNQSRHLIADIAKDYFEVYAKRQDFKRFMSFYDDNAQFNDIIYGNHLSGKHEIAEFLNWNKGHFKLLSGNEILTVTSQTVEDNSVVTEGYFHQFSYDKQNLGPWLFIIKLEFNDQGKVVKQTDWINYTPREHFLGGQNMNNKLIKDK